ncbi:MAG: hypothetical protein NT106_07065 [Candidatus Sumerlaeota bacterium]|nr:hypothetical protein [Candidatus Sumerlaeota bacterium]
MNGYERILKSFRQEPTDRIPIFEQSVSGSVITEILGRPALGFATDLHFDEAQALSLGAQAYQEFIGRLKEDYSAFVDAIDMDMVSVPWLLWEKPAQRLDDFSFLYKTEDGECIRTYDPQSRTFDISTGGQETSSKKDVRRFIKNFGEKRSGGSILPEEYWEFLRWLIDTFGQKRCVAGAGYYGIPVSAEWLIILLEDPGFIRDYLDILTAREMCVARLQAELGIRVINGGGDLASKNGPVYSPSIFRDLFLPGLKRIISCYHSLGAFYIYRTDGNIWQLAELLLSESGADAYGEIDIDAGMDLVELRQRFPRLVLWGGLSCGSLLLKGTDEQIVSETRRLRGALAPSGGWIFGSSNTLLPGTNVSGYLAALKELRT